MLPAFETTRLNLRPSHLTDLENFLAMDIDPAVARYIWGSPPDPVQRRAELERRLRSENPKPGGSWTVADKATSEFLGWCGLMPLEETGLVEIGYRYLPKAWGRGIATEAAARLLDHGFRDLQFDPIVAVSHLENLASHRVLRKIGLQRRADAVHCGQMTAVFGLSRVDYLAAEGRDDGNA